VQSPRLTWINHEASLAIQVSLSSGCSVLLCVLFHHAILQTGVDEIAHRRAIRFCCGFGLFHIFLFVFSRIIYTQWWNNSTLNTVAALVLVVFKIYISIYFLWGHRKAYLIFKKTEENNPRNRHAMYRMGKKMTLISITNMLTLLCYLLISFDSVIHYRHGWSLMLYAELGQGLTTLIEVLSLPKPHARNAAFGKSDEKSEQTSEAGLILSNVLRKLGINDKKTQVIKPQATTVQITEQGH
jgi:hypothetical protein